VSKSMLWDRTFKAYKTPGNWGYLIKEPSGRQGVKKLNFELLEHPLYSPDLASLDYHLFGPLKQFLRCCQLTLDQQLKEVHSWFVPQPKTFYSEGIKKVVLR